MDHWYVVQVMSGKESRMVEAIRHAAAKTPDGIDCGLKEIFIPRYRTERKVRGVFVPVERPMIPGYVIVVAQNAGKLDLTLRRVRGFTRLLRSECGYEALTPDEVAWFETFLDLADRIVPMSEALKEGDEVLMVDGPLRDHQTKITRIDRRRSLAYVQISILGRTKEVPVGLRILAKAPSY